MGWISKFFTAVANNVDPPKATGAQRNAALSELIGKIDLRGENPSDAEFARVQENLKKVKTFMHNLSDLTERDAYNYWVVYFEDKFQRQSDRKDKIRKSIEDDKKASATISRPDW